MGQCLYVMHKKDTKDGCMFKLMPTPVNALPHRYIKDLACIHRDLAMLETGRARVLKWNKYGFMQCVWIEFRVDLEQKL